MRITSPFLAFIFIGVAAAGVIPGIAVRDSASNGQGGHTLGSPSGVPDHSSQLGSVTLSHSLTGHPTDLPHSFHVTPSDVSDHPKPTGNYPRPAGSRRDAPTDVPHPSVTPSNVSDYPKPTGKLSHHAASRRDNNATVTPQPSVSPFNVSDHPKPTGKHSRPAASGSHTADPTDGHSSPPAHSHDPASRRAKPTDQHSQHSPIPHTTGSHASDAHSHTIFGSSDYPKPTGTGTGTPTHPRASHNARALHQSAVHSHHYKPSSSDSSHHPKSTGNAV